MADFERGMDQFSFLYENREPCNTIALMQMGLSLLFLCVNYEVWWCALLGFIVALIGYYGSVEPVIQSKVSFIQFYYFGNCFMFILQLVSAILLIVLVTSWKHMGGWGWTVLLLGTFSMGIQAYVSFQAIQKSHAYRAELMRNPPPSENAYGQNTSGAAYTAMSSTYKPANIEVKAI